MLSIANEIDPLIFYCVCFVWDTNMYFSNKKSPRISPGISMCFENIPCKAIYIVKIGVWNDSQTMWDSLQTSALMQKTCLFSVSGTLHTHIRSGLHAQVDSCVRMLRVSLVLFSKNRFICSLKVIFFILTFFKSI